MNPRPPPLRNVEYHFDYHAVSFTELAENGHLCAYCNTHTTRVRIALMKDGFWPQHHSHFDESQADHKVVSCVDEECISGALVDLQLRLSMYESDG